MAFLSTSPIRPSANSRLHVTEKVWSPYAMAPLDGELGAATLTGNIGLQGVHTDLDPQSSGSQPHSHTTIIGCGCQA